MPAALGAKSLDAYRGAMASTPPQDAVPAAPQADGGPLIVHLRDRDEADALLDWSAWGATPLVATFGQPQIEYSAVRKACGLMPRPERGLIEVTGRDRHSFLNNLLTNGLVGKETKQPLPPGHGCYAFLLNLKGRVVADCHVLEVPGGDRTLLDVDRAAAAMLVEVIDGYRFAEKVKLKDVSADWQSVALHGPTATDILAAAADGPAAFEPTPDDFPATVDVPVALARFAGVEAVAYRDDICGVPGVHLWLPADRVVGVWDDLTTRFGETLDDRRFGERRLTPLGWAMFNACRIEAGRPLLGVDFPAAPPSRAGKSREDPPKGGALPAETGRLFDRAVSVTSGCYLGQEVVARMHARRVTAKQIVGIRMADDALPTAGVPVEVDDGEVGTVTSSTISPVLSAACLCLATIKRPHFEIGTKVTIPAEGRNAAGEVVALPFLD